MKHTLKDRPPPYGTVVFDCDSTLSDMEGIEYLARGEVAREVARLTDAAMAGEVPLEEVFGRRLELLKPSRADLERVGEAYVERALPNAAPLVAALRSLGKRVAIVSGGLTLPVERLARHLGIEEVHAVDVRLEASGAYAGFDEASPLARAGGKIDVLGQILAGGEGGGLAFVGDGATDLEAAHLADRFIAFGGVARRDAVFRGACVGSTERDLAHLVPLLLDANERGRLRSTERFPTLFDSDDPA